MSCQIYVKRYAESEGYAVRPQDGTFLLHNDRTGTVWPVCHPTRQAAWDAFDRTLRQRLAGDPMSWLKVSRFDPNRRIARAGHFDVVRADGGFRWTNEMTGDESEGVLPSDDAAWEAAAAEAALFAMDRGGIEAEGWSAMTGEERVEAVSDAYDRSLGMRF